jgi:hypothetical protein
MCLFYFETNDSFLRILMWASYREIRKIFNLFSFLNFLFWFYNTDPSKIWEFFVFEECKAAWLMRNNVSCPHLFSSLRCLQWFKTSCYDAVRLLNNRRSLEVFYCLHLECLSISNLSNHFLTPFTIRTAVSISNETSWLFTSHPGVMSEDLPLHCRKLYFLSG